MTSTTAAATESESETGSDTSSPTVGTSDGMSTTNLPSSSSDAGCTSNEDCGDVEVCFNGECTIATEVGYRVEITSWQPEDCGTVATPDLYVVVSRNGNDGPPTATASSCPAAWSSFCIDGPVDAANVIEFQLWDEDVGDDELFDRLCWPTPTDPNATCGPLSPSMLHDGGYEGGTAMNGQISISFTPGC